MSWKLSSILLTVFLIVVVVVFHLSPFGESFVLYKPTWSVRNTRKFHTITYSDNFDFNTLNKNIVAAYLVFRNIPYNCQGITPLTKRISHWSICLMLSSGEYIIVSYEREIRLCVYPVRYSSEKQLMSSFELLNISIKRFDLPPDKQITLSKFLDISMEYITKNVDTYNVFGKSNCQHATKDILEKVLDIHDDAIMPESNSKIFTDIINYKNYSIDYKDRLQKKN